MARARDYKREYALFHGTPNEIKKRAQRNKSRRKLARQGLVSKHDGNDVHHVNHDVYNQSKGNLAVISKHKNRSIK